MRSRKHPALTSPLLTWALRRARRGEVDAKVIIIIILAVVGVMMLGVCGVIALVMLPAVQQARTASRSTHSRDNLHNIGLALHNYHDVYGMFAPGGIYGEDGTEYISWQTSILPYVDQAPLYNRIDMEVPWTDPVNSLYYSTAVEPYLHPSIGGLPVNGQGFAVSHYAGSSHVFGPNSGTRIREITDGTSNTVMAGEVAAGFKPWADPSNLRDPAAGISRGLDTFSNPDRDGVMFLMGDGAVRFVSGDISPDVLEAIATPDGGEWVGDF